MKEKLKEDYLILQKQFAWLKISYDECSLIGIKDEY
jgi:uncharacterized protein YecT (DUF1311 family)